MTAAALQLSSSSQSSRRGALLFGRDETTGIVCVSANRRGHARIWRRVGDEVVYEEDAYPNWFFLARRDLLEDLPVVDLDPSIIESGVDLPPEVVGLVRLRGDN